MSVYSPAQIAKYVSIPTIAWPTVLLVGNCCICIVGVAICLQKGFVSPYFASTVNTVLIFAVFTPMHDAAHGSVATSRFRFVNTVVGNLAAACFPLPYPAFKHLHLLHHKHTNEELDPDLWAGAGPTLLLPLRWFSIEYKYYTSYLPKLHLRPRGEALWTIVSLTAMIALIVTLCRSGYGTVVFYGWLLPGRIAIGLLAYFFDYLPHRPHKISKKADPYKATSVTSLFGENTWLLTWPLLHQNYHNIHHLAPYIPFYQYSTVWHKLKPELLERGTKIKPMLQ